MSARNALESRVESTALDSGSEAASGDDPRVVEALEEYLGAVERGEAPDRSVFLARHAEIAEDLSACLDGLELVRGASPGMRTPDSCGCDPEGEDRPGDAHEMPRLGDYRLLREIGRGGMGVVYEAEQVSLGRRVALKVLPFAAATDARQRQRFKLEAQAAACLHHANIVPIFAVGCDRGVHYYAMQYIEGRTLGDVIAELGRAGGAARRGEANPLVPETLDLRGGDDSPAARPPAESIRTADAAGSGTLGRSARGREIFRAAARLGVQAAEALEHAHSLGIVHRDIKPANLLVDGRGNLWITDFGLARVQRESSLTMTGDLLGTLRYMSPEQALARRVVVDHRTDIYSLGVTLYELATLRPAFDGRDRQELLRQIALEEPKAPRRVEPAIPRELETIILKAMAKEPADRYATARDLADDLRRFLEDRPIAARRASILDRSARWARRHKPMVASAAALAVLAAAVFAVSTVLIARERDEARARRQRAVDRAALARRVIDEVFAKAEEWFPQDSNLARRQREVLAEMLSYYQRLADDDSRDPQDRWDAAIAGHRVGDIQWALGHLSEAEHAYRRGLGLLQGLESWPSADEPVVLPDLATLNRRLGRLLQATYRPAESEAAYRRAIDAQQRHAARVGGPEARLTLASIHLDFGDMLACASRDPEALAAYGKALALTESVPSAPAGAGEAPCAREEVEALSAVIRCHLKKASGRFDEAEQAAREAVALYSSLKEARPSRRDYRSRLASSDLQLAWLVARPADPARRRPEQAIELARKAAELEPQNAHNQNSRAMLLLALGEYRQAKEVFTRVLALAPDSPDAHNSLAWFLSVCDEPHREPARAVHLAERAVELAPKVGIYWNTLGVARYRQGDWPGALAALQTSMSLRDGGDSYDWFFVAMVHRRLGDPSQAREWYDRAVAWMRGNRPKELELAAFRREAEALLAQPPGRRHGGPILAPAQWQWGRRGPPPS